jgi:hypothetical protein
MDPITQTKLIDIVDSIPTDEENNPGSGSGTYCVIA